jgi:hypothetical protein
VVCGGTAHPNILEGGIIVRDCQEYLSWLCAMMHEMHHSVLLAQWSAEVRHTLTVTNTTDREWIVRDVSN